MLHQLKKVSALGPLIAAERRAQGLKQQRLADLSNVSCHFLSDLENGKPTVELDKVLAVVNRLGLELHISSRRAAGTVDET